MHFCVVLYMYLCVFHICVPILCHVCKVVCYQYISVLCHLYTSVLCHVCIPVLCRFCTVCNLVLCHACICLLSKNVCDFKLCTMYFNVVSRYVLLCCVCFSASTLRGKESLQRSLEENTRPYYPMGEKTYPYRAPMEVLNPPSMTSQDSSLCIIFTATYYD